MPPTSLGFYMQGLTLEAAATYEVFVVVIFYVARCLVTVYAREHGGEGLLFE